MDRHVLLPEDAEDLAWRYRELRDRVEEVRDQGSQPQVRQAARWILEEHDEAVAKAEEEE